METFLEESQKELLGKLKKALQFGGISEKKNLGWVSVGASKENPGRISEGTSGSIS